MAGSTTDIGYVPVPFDVSTSSDPEVAVLVKEACESDSDTRFNVHDVTLLYFTSTPAGEELFRKNTDWNRRGLLAVVEQLHHWDSQCERVVEQAEDDAQRRNKHLLPGGPLVGRQIAKLSLAGSYLARRRLPFSWDDLLTLLPVARPRSSFDGIDAALVLKQVESVASEHPLPDVVRSALLELRSQKLLIYWDSDKKLRGSIDRLTSTEKGSTVEEQAASPPPPTPGPAEPAGNAGVLVDLKRRMSVLSKNTPAEVETTPLEPDRYPLRADSPLVVEHGVLSEWFNACIEEVYLTHRRDFGVEEFLETRAMRKLSLEERGRLLLASCERAVAAVVAALNDAGGAATSRTWAVRYGMVAPAPTQIEEEGVELDRDSLFDVLLYVSTGGRGLACRPMHLLAQLRELLGDEPLTAAERYVLHRLRCRAIVQPPLGVCPPVTKLVCEIMGEPDGYWLVPGEHWSDLAHDDLRGMKEAERARWQAVLNHAARATSSSPSKKWEKEANPLVKALTPTRFRERLATWFFEARRGRSVPFIGAYQTYTQDAADTFNDGNLTILRGLVWMFTRHADARSPRTLADLMMTSLKKVPGVGPRAVKLANACVWGLGEMAASGDLAIRESAVGQLARLKAKVTFKTTLKMIEKALDKAAQASGMSREDLEELGVPSFGFKGGVLREELGGASVELRVEGNRVVTRWTNEKGKPVKSPPAAVKREFKEEVKELQQAAKDAEGILLAGRSRLDNLYLAQKSWPLSDWRERYLDHGLLSTIAGRLIWTITAGGRDTVALWVEDRWFGFDGRPTDIEDHDATVRLWHPIGEEPEAVVAWRDFLMDREITQPFKQADREVYVLTDAERNTGTYSNRFAAHILKQHQFNALCGARGWRNTLRLLVDDSYAPPTLELPGWGLRAEFWVEGAETAPGADQTDTGTYLYLATDQVRFYRADAARNSAHAGGGGYGTSAGGPGRGNPNQPLPISDVPPLVFSEVMRDVDLFVGVSSVGNDPQWADGGRETRQVAYWHDFSFGDLNATAQTRRGVLERLVPRLKIADRCEIADKFLRVRGERRTYKIHLGSGNILMEPNDQYLCIVPDASAGGGGRGADGVKLPFEGDRTLSIILSKAFMLADDRKVTDPTILSQIGRE